MLPALFEPVFWVVAFREMAADLVDAATDCSNAGSNAGNREILARPSSPPALQILRVQAPAQTHPCAYFLF
jgi:hypothetical protein